MRAKYSWTAGPISKLSDEELRAVIDEIKAQAEAGITVVTMTEFEGVGIAHTEERLTGKDARKHLGLKPYLKEAKKRQEEILARLRTPVCRIEKMQFNYRLTVDDMCIYFQDTDSDEIQWRDPVEYFTTHYSRLGYLIERDF